MAGNKTTLGRLAVGLPRYYMDCGWYRAPRFVGLDPAALFVFEACVGYCTQHATDGRLPGDLEDLAVALGVRASAVRKAIPLLIEREALLRDRCGELAVRGWAEHNPTAAEVEAYAEEKSRAGSWGNHVRWHVERGVVQPGCDHCDSDDDPFSDRICDRSLRSQTDH